MVDRTFLLVKVFRYDMLLYFGVLQDPSVLSSKNVYFLHAPTGTFIEL